MIRGEKQLIKSSVWTICFCIWYSYTPTEFLRLDFEYFFWMSLDIFNLLMHTFVMSLLYIFFMVHWILSGVMWCINMIKGSVFLGLGACGSPATLSWVLCLKWLLLSSSPLMPNMPHDHVITLFVLCGKCPPWDPSDGAARAWGQISLRMSKGTRKDSLISVVYESLFKKYFWKHTEIFLVAFTKGSQIYFCCVHKRKPQYVCI